MCIGGSSSSAPTPPAALPEAPRLPDVSTSKGRGNTDARRRASATGGDRSTILTSARGVQDGGQTTMKTLLGQ